MAKIASMGFGMPTIGTNFTSVSRSLRIRALRASELVNCGCAMRYLYSSAANAGWPPPAMVASFVVGLVPLVGQVIGLLLIWPQLCIHAKRLHDMGRSALWMVVPFCLSSLFLVLAVVKGGKAVLEVLSAGSSNATRGAAWSQLGIAVGYFAMTFLVGLAFLLWVGLSRGEPGSNRFGPPPERLIR